MSDLDAHKPAAAGGTPQGDEMPMGETGEQRAATESVAATGEGADTSVRAQDTALPADAGQERVEAPVVMPVSHVQQPTDTVGAPIAASAPDVDARARSVALDNQLIEQQMHRMSRRSFLWGAVAAAAGYGGLRWLTGQPTEDGILRPLRRMMQFNEGLARGYYRDSRLAPTFPRAQAQMPRSNGDIGLTSDFDADAWKLYVVGLADTTGARTVSLPIPNVVEDDSTPLPEKRELALALDMAAIKALPRVEMVTELKCIEGWSTIVHWAGARFADFVAHYAPQQENGQLPKYVGMQTPDGRYFVGMDMASAMHPQTLLCYEMNGAPLADDHGAPLRLVTPVKYGIKHIKRIGAIRFTNERPIDYWAVLGYDWYAGH